MAEETKPEEAEATEEAAAETTEGTFFFNKINAITSERFETILKGSKII